MLRAGGFGGGKEGQRSIWTEKVKGYYLRVLFFFLSEGEVDEAQHVKSRIKSHLGTFVLLVCLFRAGKIRIR